MRVGAWLRRVALLTLVLLAGAVGTLAVAMIVHPKGLDGTASATTIGAFAVAILADLQELVERCGSGFATQPRRGG